MKILTVSKNDSGQRLDKYLLKVFPKLPKSLMYKEIRKKNIKINKKRTQPDYIIKECEEISLYLKDDVLEEKKKHYDFTKAPTELNILYEDENIMLIDKQPGLLCHPDGKEYTATLIAAVKRRLFKSGEWKPDDDEAFTPSLANRIDRNTGGIVIAAKNAQALRILNDKIKTREIEKHYLAAVHGRFDIKSAELTAYLTKNERTNTVSVFDKEKPCSKKIITEYTVIDEYGDYSLLDIDLKTGRTHQIRAHMAHIGHPLLNDGKYGTEEGRFRQALYSYKLIFNIKDAGILNYLAGREFTAENCEILRKFKERKF